MKLKKYSDSARNEMDELKRLLIKKDEEKKGEANE